MMFFMSLVSFQDNMNLKAIIIELMSSKTVESYRCLNIRTCRHYRCESKEKFSYNHSSG